MTLKDALKEDLAPLKPLADAAVKEGKAIGKELGEIGELTSKELGKFKTSLWELVTINLLTLEKS